MHVCLFFSPHSLYGALLPHFNVFETLKMTNCRSTQNIEMWGKGEAKKSSFPTHEKKKACLKNAYFTKKGTLDYGFRHYFVKVGTLMKMVKCDHFLPACTYSMLYWSVFSSIESKSFTGTMHSTSDCSIFFIVFVPFLVFFIALFSFIYDDTSQSLLW